MHHRLLVCDDSLFMRSAIIQALEAVGYTVVSQAETGADAIRLYKELVSVRGYGQGSPRIIR